MEGQISHYKDKIKELKSKNSEYTDQDKKISSAFKERERDFTNELNQMKEAVLNYQQKYERKKQKLK